MLFEQSFVKDLLGSGVNQVHAENPESLSGLEISSILLDQWKKSQGAKISTLNYSYSSAPIFQKDLCWQKYRPHKDLGGSTAYSYSLPSRKLRSVLGGLTTVGEDNNAFICANGEEYQIHGSKYAFILFEQNWKISYFCNFLEIHLQFFPKFLLIILEIVWRLFKTWKINSDFKHIPIN